MAFNLPLASRFGDILHRKPTTPPDVLVLSILQPRTFSCDATNWGIQNESTAIEAYIAYQDLLGKHVTVRPAGFFVSESHPFLGASLMAMSMTPLIREKSLVLLKLNALLFKEISLH